MPSDEYKAIVRRHYEQLNQQNLDAVVEDYAVDTKVHGFALQPLSRDEYKQAIAMFLTAFPDAHVPIEDMIAEGDKVAVRLTFEGTHRGDFQGIPPTGRRVMVPATAIFRFDERKIVEGWLNLDFLGLMQQLGVIPASG